MDARRWDRVNELFEAAIARSIDERRAFLADACAGDEALVTELQRLVQAHERACGFLEAPVAPHALRILGLSAEGAAGQAPLTLIRAGAAFRGTDRFAVRRLLGAGGMGMVYEVHDRVRNEIVALKTMLRARADHIYRLKREFRSLADVSHPNLVSLYELIVEGSDCFFTMELVNGVDLVEYVRAGSIAGTQPDYDRVRRVLHQLVDGIRALHQSGKLHRDIKPSNVLVTAEERVVVLDFGLVGDVAPGELTTRESLSGTPAYVAPERRARAAPCESQDWYSVGVTLYEALTGLLPLDATDAPSPRQVAPEVPDDVEAICMGLLQRDPSSRLAGEQVMDMLAGRAALMIEARASEKEPESVFVGRRRQLEMIDAALAKVKSGFAATVYVHGPSGIGKSALVEHFLRLAAGREEVAVLRGRCYERESVPYKALDGVVDNLSQQLSILPESQLAALLPLDLGPLLRLFPVMLQVRTARSRAQDVHAADPIVLRQRAFDALRNLLTRMAARRPLVVFIDDLHWADADSVALLQALLRRPQAPAMLTIGCFRSEEVQAKPFLEALLDRSGNHTGISLPLEPMSKEEAHALLTSASAALTAASSAQVAGLAHVAGGNPLLLRQIADYVTSHHLSRQQMTLADMLEDRLRALPTGGKRFLETLSICGRAMAPEVVYEAAGLVGDERPLVARLRAARFLRASGSAQRVEVYHDRIRETLAANVTADDKRTLHGLLARTLVYRGADEPEGLYEHYREAGDDEQASVQAARAGQKAETALAFDRAVSYYRAALELAANARAHRDWRERLANALANAGRPAEAADAYLAAAVDADSTRKVELQRVAAGQLLSGGHIDRGLDVIRTVLQAARLRLARSPKRALASMLWRRVQLRWRGRAFVERDADRVPAAELLRIDTCWSVATGLATVDYVHAVDFQTRHLLLALDAGEPYRVARAFAAEVIYYGTRGTSGRAKASAALTRAETMAAHAGHPHAIALSVLARGAMAFLSGDWPSAQIHSDRALTMLRSQPGAITWELNMAQIFHLAALLFRGELRAGARELSALMDSARHRGNLYLETELRTRMNLLWLVADRPREGILEATEAMRQWSHAGFHRQHYNYMLDQIQTELYCGRAHTAWDVIDENWRTMKRTQLLRIQFARIEALYLRARCALSKATIVHNRSRFLAIARADARRLARENTPWARSLASLVSAGVHALEGRTEFARARLATAAAGFDDAHMKLYAAVARRRLGELARDDEDQDRKHRADAWMIEEGIVNLGCITRLIAPGFADYDPATKNAVRDSS
jgi:tetratricopeptide (TPR) repeat protein